MLLRYDLSVWVAKNEDGEFLDYVVASHRDEAALLLHQTTNLERFSLTEVSPFTGEELVFEET